MAIVKTDVPMTSGLAWRTIRELGQTYPFLGVETLVWTAFGRPLQVLTLGTGEKRVFFSAAHHANEWITAPVLLKFMEELASASVRGESLEGQNIKALLKAVTVYALPMVNPDGVDLVTGATGPDSPQYDRAAALAADYPDIPFPAGWKANLNGVDLNLQYPAGWRQAREIKFRKGYRTPGPRDFVGQSPLNQRESFALARFTDRINPALAVALHSQGRVIYWQFENIQVPGAEELGRKMAAVSGYALADTPYTSSFAGYKDWFIRAFRRPGYTVEVGRGENPLPLSQFDEIYDSVRKILITAASGVGSGAL